MVSIQPIDQATDRNSYSTFKSAVPPSNEQTFAETNSTKQKPALDASMVQLQVDEANAAFQHLGTTIHFKLHQESESYFVQVVDEKTNKVLKTTPPEEFLDLIGRIRKAVGLIFDEKM